MDESSRIQAPAEAVPSDSEIEDEVERLRRQWGTGNVRQVRTPPQTGSANRKVADCRSKGVAVEVKRSRRKRFDET